MTVHAGSPPRRPLTAADVLTAGEVSALLRVPRSTVEDWARRGIVPSKKVGRRRLYIGSKIEALLLSDDPEAGSPGGLSGTHRRYPMASSREPSD
jgi:excisionase family DNA binding protein